MNAGQRVAAVIRYTGYLTLAAFVGLAIEAAMKGQDWPVSVAFASLGLVIAIAGWAVSKAIKK